MNSIKIFSVVLTLLVAPLAFGSEKAVDLRKGIPADAYMAAYSQHNPKQDFLRVYQKQIWQAIEDENLPERVYALLGDLLPDTNKDAATSVADELRTIFEHVDWSAVADCRQAAYGQVMETPQTHHLLLLQLSSEDAASTLEKAIRDTNDMIQRRSEGKVVAAVENVDGVELLTLSVPKIKEFPFQPAFARKGDVLLFSSSATVARQCIELLLHGGQSKFDDPRLQEALTKLPKPETALVFYDVRQQFRKLEGIGQFIREKAPKDEKALRAAGVLDHLMSDLTILDYQVTIGRTDDQRIIKTEFGQLVPDAQDKPLYKVFASGQPFEDWQRWVPADAKAYSLHTGANLHALYEWAVGFIQKEFPEAQPQLDKFEALQEKWGVHIDRDILQAFSGELVAVKLPATSPSTIGGQDKVIALRCEKPDRIRKLLHQGIERLAKNPYAQSQQLKFESAKGLEGFDELSANMLSAFGVKPVIGFHDGWMMIASNAAAAQKVIRTRSGEAPSIDQSKQFKEFGLEVEGPVAAISYSDLAASTRQTAQVIRQLGMIAPIFVASAGAKNPEKMKLLQDAIGLLPSIANVIEKFDFLDARLTVVQKGDTPGSYLKRSVTLVRLPA
jgi:hypothetical protein